MPVTLAEAALNVTDELDLSAPAADEFRRLNWLLAQITFDDVVSAQGGTLTHTYMRTLTPSGAAFRAVNSEYVPNEAKKIRQSVDLQALGGSFQIDRILDAVGAAAETEFQMTQKIKATANFFSDRLINGDGDNHATETKRAAAPLQATGFDGLAKGLVGEDTEINEGGAEIDLLGVSSQTEAFAVMRSLDQLLGELDGEAGAILTNRQTRYALIAAARYANALGTVESEFGKPIESYNGIPFVDLGNVAATNGATQPIVRVAAGLTSIYAVRFGLDGLHGASLAGRPLVQAWAPDFSTAGAVKTGEVEMVVAPVLKAARAAGVLRNVRVAAA